jgi:hypothetical protein
VAATVVAATAAVAAAMVAAATAAAVATVSDAGGGVRILCQLGVVRCCGATWLCEGVPARELMRRCRAVLCSAAQTAAVAAAMAAAPPAPGTKRPLRGCSLAAGSNQPWSTGGRAQRVLAGAGFWRPSAAGQQ